MTDSKYIDADLKRKMHDAGFNVFAFSVEKRALVASCECYKKCVECVKDEKHGKYIHHRTGAICEPQEKTIEKRCLEATRWGIRPTTDPRADDKLLLDWDFGECPQGLIELMCTKREKINGQISYHGILQVEGATRAQLKEFAKEHGIDGLEILVDSKQLTMFGNYEVKNTNGEIIKNASWEWQKDKKYGLVTKTNLQELRRLIPRKPGQTKTKKTRIMTHTANNNNNTPLTNIAWLDAIDQKITHPGRHEAFIQVSSHVVRYARGKISIDDAYGQVMQLLKDKIDDIGLFERGGSRYDEVRDIVSWDIRNYDTELANQTNLDNLDSREPIPYERLFPLANKVLAEQTRGLSTIDTKTIDNTGKILTDAVNIDDSMREQLQKIFDEAAKYNYDNVQFMHGFMRNKHFASIKGRPESEQYHGFVYDENSHIWRDGLDQFVFQSTFHLKGTKMTKDREFKPTTRASKEASRCIISDSTITTEFTLDAKWQKQRALMIIDPYGNYWDIPTGKIKQIDPSIHYFDRIDVQFKLDDTLDKPEHWNEFLLDRFGDDDAKIRDDHLCGSYLPASVLGSKPKCLLTIGKTDTFKSMPQLIMKKILGSDKVRNVSMRDMARDPFVIGRLEGLQLNFFDELPLKGKALDILKEVITSEALYARIMRQQTDREITPPRFDGAGNTIPELVASGEDIDSIMNRVMILETKPVIVKKDWRKLIVDDDKELHRIQMHQLKRATEIYNNPKLLCTQTIDDATKRYEKMHSGDLDGIINANCIETLNADTGMKLTEVKKLFKEKTNHNISTNQIRDLLNELDDYNVTDTRRHCKSTGREKKTWILDSTGKTMHELLLGYMLKTDLTNDEIEGRLKSIGIKFENKEKPLTDIEKKELEGLQIELKAIQEARKDEPKDKTGTQTTLNA